MAALARLQDLLRDLFQYNECGDLDFGIYRLLRLKREEIDQFLVEQLPRRVHEAFEQGSSAEVAALERRLAELREQIQRDIASDAILPDGSVRPDLRDSAFRAVREPIREYDDARARRLSCRASEDQQALVYNHLHAFFSRYYDDGDFIPRRRYGASETYAVPYNGEEVFFHWANRNQHYVKTAENLRDFAFNVDVLGRSFRVRFTLAEATQTPNNNKGDVRHFFPRPDLASFDAAAFTLPFEYRQPTPEETTRYGKNSRGQDAVLREAEPAILAAVPDLGLHDALAALPSPQAGSSTGETRKQEPPSLLLLRLRQFTRRNTSDYFVHKNLERFLSEELDFYLKDQVVHLADLESDLEPTRRILRVIRQVAGDIIAFLAQIEEAQKRLFEKRKFVLRCDYLAPISSVPRDLWSTVLASEKQRAAWRTLFDVGSNGHLFDQAKPLDEAFLEDHPTLIVDTRLMEDGFASSLLNALPAHLGVPLDDCLDGLLLHAENYQALRFLLPCHAERVQCIYIDPPYNSDAGPILYKNGYRHSSWLSLLDGRVGPAVGFLDDAGVLCITIDHVELHRLLGLTDEILPQYDLLGLVAIKNNPAGRTAQVGFSVCHEYALFLALPEYAQVGRLEHTDSQKARYKEQDEIGPFEWTNFRKHGGLNTYRDRRPRQYYPIYVRPDGTIHIPDMEWKEPERRYEILEDPGPGDIVVEPRDENNRERIWDFVVATARANIKHLKVRKDANGQTAIYRKWRINEQGLLPQTWWDRSQYSAVEYGTNLLARIFGETHTFTFPKSVHAVADCLKVGGLRNNPDGLALDFFAGSGTTAHAVVNLNREDGGCRKFILVEMGGYFDTVLLPRVQKVMYAPEWENGKPKRLPSDEEAERTPRLIKILRLESYEDALHNLTTDETIRRAQPRAEAHRRAVGPDEYRIRYLLRLPVDASASMLNLAALEHPFDYHIEVLTDEGPVSSPVDLVETFNYLYGIGVHRLETWHNPEGPRDYRAVQGETPDGARVLVLWRDTAGLDFERERSFLDERLAEIPTVDEVLINCDCAHPRARSLDPIFKRLMEEGER